MMIIVLGKCASQGGKPPHPEGCAGLDLRRKVWAGDEFWNHRQKCWMRYWWKCEEEGEKWAWAGSQGNANDGHRIGYQEGGERKCPQRRREKGTVQRQRGEKEYKQHHRLPSSDTEWSKKWGSLWIWLQRPLVTLERAVPGQWGRGRGQGWELQCHRRGAALRRPQTQHGWIKALEFLAMKKIWERERARVQGFNSKKEMVTEKPNKEKGEVVQILEGIKDNQKWFKPEEVWETQGWCCGQVERPPAFEGPWTWPFLRSLFLDLGSTLDEWGWTR